MIDKLIFTKAGTDKLFAFKYFEEKLVSIEYCDNNNIVGNIYLGQVSELAKNINAAFVTFDKDKKGFLLLDNESPVFFNNKNTTKVCQGDKILVQVESDRVKTKDYSLTCNLNLTSDLLVLTSGKKDISVSKKVRDKSKRNELKKLLESYSKETGFIVRTNAYTSSPEELLANAENLYSSLKELYKKAEKASCGELIYKASSDLERISLELLSKGCHNILTDDYECYNQIEKIINKDTKLTLYRDKSQINLLYSTEKILRDCCSKKVWLKSGAYLIIEHTEAMVVIDVNTGKSIKKGDRESTFMNINMEAANSISEEIRKRNLTGIIIIDFINMKDNDNYKKLLSHMKKLVANDDIATTIVDITELGLMEITRKKNKQPLYEILQVFNS